MPIDCGCTLLCLLLLIVVVCGCLGQGVPYLHQLPDGADGKATYNLLTLNTPAMYEFYPGGVPKQAGSFVRYLRGDYLNGKEEIPSACGSEGGALLPAPDKSVFCEFSGPLRSATTVDSTGKQVTVQLTEDEVSEEFYLAQYWARTINYFAFLDAPRVSEQEVGNLQSFFKHVFSPTWFATQLLAFVPFSQRVSAMKTTFEAVKLSIRAKNT